MKKVLALMLVAGALSSDAFAEKRKRSDSDDDTSGNTQSSKGSRDHQERSHKKSKHHHNKKHECRKCEGKTCDSSCCHCHCHEWNPLGFTKWFQPDQCNQDNDRDDNSDD